MPMYIDTRGRSTISIGICARCGEKKSREDLFDDPNAPGLKCCREDLDLLDPWTLPARPADRLALEWARPDVALPVGPQAVAILPMQAMMAATTGGAEIGEVSGAGGSPVIALAPPVTQLNPSTPWQPNTVYRVGAQVTATNPVGTAAAGNLFQIFLCIVPGTSGAVAPVWPSQVGINTSDGSVIWYSSGLYLP